MLDRNRGGAYLTVAVAGIGMFGLFLFLTYYLTGSLGFTPVQTGAAFLPMLGMIMLTAIGLRHRAGPRGRPPPAGPGRRADRRRRHGSADPGRPRQHVRHRRPARPCSSSAPASGLVFAPAQNAATAAVETRDAGVASAMINTAQQIGGSIGTALLSTFAASSASSYLAGRTPTQQLVAQASRAQLPHGVLVVGGLLRRLRACSPRCCSAPARSQVDPDAAPVLAH